MFEPGQPIKIGNLTIWTSEPPEDFEPADGERHVLLDTEDPLFKSFASTVESQGWEQTQIHNALAAYAATIEEAGDDVTVSTDGNGVMNRLREVVGDDVSDYSGLLAIATPEQLAAINGMVDRLAALEDRLTETTSANEGPVIQKSSQWTAESLRDAVADRRFREDAGFRANVESGYRQVYGSGSTPQQERETREAELRSMVADERYRNTAHPEHREYRAEVEAEYRAEFSDIA